MAARPAPGRAPVAPDTAPRDAWDCVIVGAGPAGLSAAVYMGRFRRRTLVIDDGEGRLSSRARAKLVEAGVRVLRGRVRRASGVRFETRRPAGGPILPPVPRAGGEPNPPGAG